MSGSSLKLDVLVGRGGKGGGLFLGLLITAACFSTGSRYASSSTELLPDVCASAFRFSSALNFAESDFVASVSFDNDWGFLWSLVSLGLGRLGIGGGAL